MYMRSSKEIPPFEDLVLFPYNYMTMLSWLTFGASPDKTERETILGSKQRFDNSTPWSHRPINSFIKGTCAWPSTFGCQCVTSKAIVMQKRIVPARTDVFDPKGLLLNQVHIAVAKYEHPYAQESYVPMFLCLSRWAYGDPARVVRMYISTYPRSKSVKVPTGPQNQTTPER